MPRIQAVVFDLGHTVWNFSPRTHVRRLVALQMHFRLRDTMGGGAPPPEAIDAAFISAIQRWMSVWDSDDLVQPPTERLVREALELVGVAPVSEELTALTRLGFGSERDVPTVEPDTLAAFGWLEQRGTAMGCVTNTILLEEAIAELLERLGLRRYLRSMVVSSNTDFRKPHESLFRRALEDLGVAPHEALFVGDRLIDDISGAKAIGMRAVLTHQYRQEPLAGAKVAPDGVLQRLAELPELIERLELRD